jgi:hypothetical protein
MRSAVERLDAHPPHHRGNPFASDRDALATQQIAQHPAARKRIIEMQFVDPAHDRQIGGRHRAGLII